MGRMSGLPAVAARERAAEVAAPRRACTRSATAQIGGYSTGMKQRVKLAQALVHDPQAAAPRRADQRARPGRPRRDARPDRAGSARSSGSPSWWPRICWARSSRSAITWSPSTPGGCSARTRSASFTRARQVLLVEVDRAPTELADALAAPRARRRAGTAAACSSRSRTSGPDDAIRDAVADLGLPLVRLEQRAAPRRGPLPRTPAGLDAGRDGARPTTPMTERLLASGTTDRRSPMTADEHRHHPRSAATSATPAQRLGPAAIVSRADLVQPARRRSAWAAGPRRRSSRWRLRAHLHARGRQRVHRGPWRRPRLSPTTRTSASVRIVV